MKEPGSLLVVDQGEADIKIADEDAPWRAIPHRFGVSVLFSVERLHSILMTGALTEAERAEAKLRYQQLESARRGIELVVDEQKPMQSFQIWKQQR